MHCNSSSNGRTLGFTLIELLVVIAIVSILAGAAWTNRSIFRCPSARYPNLDGFVQGGVYVSQGSYGYNAVGAAGEPALAPDSHHHFGLGGVGLLGQTSLAVKESQVLVPGEMLALGDVSLPGFPIIHPSFRAPVDSPSEYAPHRRRFNSAFCDGHVESLTRAELYEPMPDYRRRWNRDHEPHPELWRDGLTSW